MGSRLSRYVIYPVVSLDNGKFSISDETLVNIWQTIEQEGKIESLFYDGSIKDVIDWIKFIKSPGIFPIIVWDSIKKKIVHILWLKDCFDLCAWVHHVSIGPYQRGVWEACRDHWKKFDSLKLLLGLTPSTNPKAVKILKKICKFNIVGEIPWVCNMAYEGKRVSGIISYFEL
jgi:hypothetical protein